MSKSVLLTALVICLHTLSSVYSRLFPITSSVPRVLGPGPRLLPQSWLHAPRRTSTSIDCETNRNGKDADELTPPSPLARGLPII